MSNMLRDHFTGIIFDMDGVITDTEPLHVEAERQTCRDYGFDAPLAEWDGFKGRTADDIFAYLVAKYGAGRADAPTPAEMIRHKTGIYLKLAQAGLPLVPGSVDFIKTARGHFSKVALATSSNGAVQRAVFDRYNLDPYFDAVTTGDELTRGKPDPQAYLKAAAKIGLPPAACLVVEDSDNGIRAAKSAGCTVAGITTSFPGELLAALGAAIVVDNYSDLARHLGLNDAA